VVHKSFFDIANLPLVQYFKIQSKKSSVKEYIRYFHPLCGDLAQLPYRDESFDFISALDVLEHIKDDYLAVSEISRILKKNGIAIIVVPRGTRYYNKQDKLIGHYRRYEIEQIISLFSDFKLKCLKLFGIYGYLMKLSWIQTANPKKIEASLINLRNRYESSIAFRKLWNIIVNISSKAMKIDAKCQPIKRIMNIGMIFTKK
jgi:SAM-dependent methyltransferase